MPQGTARRTEPTVDIPHMIARAILILGVILGVNRARMLATMGKGRKTLMQALMLFVVLFILNPIWPYGSGI